MKKINDIDLKNWKDYDHVETDSLWVIDSRDSTGAHDNSYHGNFVPQIPRQLMWRYTRKGDVVLDPFLGSGTTLIECKRLERHGIGVELIPDIAEQARQSIDKEPVVNDAITSQIIVGDTKVKKTYNKILENLESIGKTHVDLAILHPPYHNIIQFSEHKEDLCNTESTSEFIKKFGWCVDVVADTIKKGGHLAVVIGDKYEKSEWIPLSFYVMKVIMTRTDYTLKSVVVKNMVNNRAKQNQQNLWRYRALAGGFYIFKHEYIMIFRNTR